MSVCACRYWLANSCIGMGDLPRAATALAESARLLEMDQRSGAEQLRPVLQRQASVLKALNRKEELVVCENRLAELELDVPPV